MQRVGPRIIGCLCALLIPALAGTAARGQTAQPVTIKVELPRANAKLTIDDAATQQTGVSRKFASPPLEPGKTYSYTLKAVWQPNNYETVTRTRVIKFKPGEEVVVDLRVADENQPDKRVIRYVPTPAVVTDAMCKLAGVGKDDVVYDLGCGDGRLVITAVKKYGAKHGVGVDIDPERIADSNANLKESGLGDKVEFRQGDVLEIKDLSEASVVMLYMSDDLNLQLRPILQKTLKPGSRIVSHRFTMGDWEPAKTETVLDGGKPIKVLLWKIEEPAK
jgi:uncharacterized protein (TIGR03000 family)